MNLADAIRAHARRRPTHPAIEFRGRAISYAELDRAVDAAAGMLRARGIAPGEHVGIALSDRPEHLAFLFGAARLGAVFVPVDCRWTPGEKARVCQSFGVRLVVVDPEEYVPPVPALPVPPGWIHEQRAEGGGVPAGATGNAPVAIYLSSGTTGQPKGPVLTHANIAARFDIYSRHLRLGPEDRFACVTPLYFSASRGFAMCMLSVGGTVVLLPLPMGAKDLAGAINGSRCTSASLVPTQIRRLLAEAQDGLLLPRLRTLISTGAPLNAQERAEAMERISPHLYSFYGSSEGGGVSVLSPGDPAERADSAGRILPETEVRIVGADFQPLPEGEVGRICYRGPATARRFHGARDEAEAPLRDGWFLPGDLGRVEGRYVYITGREKDMILRGGVNVYPEEIERVLRAHPAVSDAAVVGAPSAEFGEEVVAYVALCARAEDAELAEWCRRELAPYKVPRQFIRVPELPKTPIGKPDKVALRARAAEAAAG